MNKRFNILTTAVLFLSTAAITFISCNPDDPTPIIVKEATTIELVSGGSQTDFTEATLEDAIEVLVKDLDGNAFAGEIVTFTVIEGSVSAAAVTTGTDGKASVTWTLGETEGTQVLTITGTSTLTQTPITVIATAEYKPVIGDFKYGGVIFYIDDTEKSGLVCTVSDNSTTEGWGCSGTELTGADGTAIGTGKQNTIDIEAECTDAGTAADVCVNLTLNSFDDWFLPSKDELNEMYLNKATINATAAANSGIAFSETTPYWSSTESFSLGSWAQSMDTGAQNQNSKDLTANLVRAVREF